MILKSFGTFSPRDRWYIGVSRSLSVTSNDFFPSFRATHDEIIHRVLARAIRGLDAGKLPLVCVGPAAQDSANYSSGYVAERSLVCHQPQRQEQHGRRSDGPRRA